MLNQLEKEGKTIRYTIRKSRRAKRPRIAVYCDASVVVTLPEGFNETNPEKFLKAKWDWILEKVDYFKTHKNALVIKADKIDYRKNKIAAFNLAKQKVEELNNFYGFKYNSINIRNQKTRWGSCSKKGNLSFSYKIVFLSTEQTNYLVAHELCHLKEFNHSKAFWHLVSKTIPDYLKLKKILNNIAILSGSNSRE